MQFIYFVDIEDEDDGYDVAYADDWMQNNRNIQPRQGSLDIEPLTSTSNIYYDENNEVHSAMPTQGQSSDLEIVQNTHNIYYET